MLNNFVGLTRPAGLKVTRISLTTVRDCIRVQTVAAWVIVGIVWKARWTSMNAPKALFGDEMNGGAWLHRTLSFVLKSIRGPLHGILQAFRPWVVVALVVVCVVSVLVGLFFALVMPGSHFPMLFVFGLCVGSALFIVLYDALMELLLPR
jgi:hypothetical protein